ncbi:hypothetical protein [Fulvivirga ligni]|uniref:hypothetical protein n=1 Tax=Fulvivirga ligni TaxID=2904246 RepID=UPI001F44DE48|nr:hypothetical protein [Fulvivirga ligni]UII23374.1 hypothetical protein LVD16_09060 [Fulvivirga ligni]
MKHIIIICLLICCFSCSNPKPEVSFYHWKAKAEYSEPIKTTLRSLEANDIYLHYFDVDDVKDPSYQNDGLYPVYVLRQVDSAYRDYNIIPVIFIANEALKKASIDQLADRIHALTDQISGYHFGKILTDIQIDCDWTQTTANAYFDLLKKLEAYYRVSVTIRLHQIKYKDKTGIPPVYEGVLMLYNMGKLNDEKANSILSTNIISSYINKESDYPLTLKVALPLFSQTVIINKNGEVKLINHVNESTFAESSTYFDRVNDHLFEVKKDTLFHGFYLTNGYKIKLEKASPNDIAKAYHLITQSKIKTDGIIFYHLDDAIFRHTNPTEILDQL